MFPIGQSSAQSPQLTHFARSKKSRNFFRNPLGPHPRRESDATRSETTGMRPHEARPSAMSSANAAASARAFDARRSFAARSIATL